MMVFVDFLAFLTVQSILKVHQAILLIKLIKQLINNH